MLLRASASLGVGNGPADCPTNFDCASNACVRRKCTSDAVCQGYCVDGFCGDALGSCEQPRG